MWSVSLFAESFCLEGELYSSRQRSTQCRVSIRTVITIVLEKTSKVRQIWVTVFFIINIPRRYSKRSQVLFLLIFLTSATFFRLFFFMTLYVTKFRILFWVNELYNLSWSYLHSLMNISCFSSPLLSMLN